MVSESQPCFLARKRIAIMLVTTLARRSGLLRQSLGRGIVGQNHEVPSTSSNLRRSDPKLPAPSQSIAAVDGSKRGWVMIGRDEEGRFDRRVVEALDDLPPVDFALIDIPIGLPESGRRNCDVQARKMLGSKRVHWRAATSAVNEQP